MRARLHLPGPLREGQRAELGPGEQHYLQRVLRLRAGQAIEVFDGAGRRFAARVGALSQRGAHLLLGEALAATPESPLRVTLAQCLSSAEKMDWTIEKAVELGVHRIVPIASARSVVRLDAERAARRVEHWRRLIGAACAQCGRDTLPGIDAPQPLAHWLDARSRAHEAVVLVPGAATRLATLALAGPEVDLLVGPEGGLADDELAAAVRAGFAAASLGARVLRTETAGLAALAILQSRLGDI